MALYKTDMYIAEYAYPLDSVMEDELIYLYQPLIGIEGYTLYNLLYTEAKRMDRFHVLCPIDRLLIYSGLSLSRLQEVLETLEAIGLLKTYRNSEDGKTKYLLRVQMPLSVKHFFANQILTTLLIHTIGRDDVMRVRDYFRIAGEKMSGYEEITARFQDVFDIRLNDKPPLKTKFNYAHKKEANFIYDYDLSLFYETLRDYQLPAYIIDNEKDYIVQLAIVYNIDAIALASLTRESVLNNHFDRELFKKKCQEFYHLNSTSQLSEVYHTQPDAYRSQQSANDPISQHLSYLETISPYQLLKEKQGGKEPVMHDLAIAETLMTQRDLTPGVVNVLLEYVLGNNDHTLNRSYCETIGASWSRKHLHTAKEAYEAIMGYERSVKGETPKQSSPAQNIQERVNDDDFMKLIEELKGETS